jgi:ubiquinone biosynthesis protein
MQEEAPRRPAAFPDPPKPGAEPSFDSYVDPGRAGLPRRLVSTARHALALAVGALAAHLRSLPKSELRRTGVLALRAFSFFACLPVSRELRRQSFPVQLRRRLEALGPTYVKFGQMLSMREDLLPRAVTDELKLLLDHLPAIGYAEFIRLVTEELERPVEEVFAHIRSTPLASASIGQTHVGTLHDGQQVVLKIVKPGVRRAIRKDALILKALAVVLQLFFARYQPRRIVGEFCEHVLRESDLREEARNAETFASSFERQPGIVFPSIHHDLSGRDLLVMQYLEGIKPTDPKAQELRDVDRERLVDLGAEAIICMLFRDGFFHADLHPGNLVILPGPRIAFIDLGMVGRFDTELKRSLLYYYYSLVTGDAESAAIYLTSLAQADNRSDLAGFRRDVEDICRHWSHRARFRSFSLARLIMESIARAGRYRMYFPLEMVLMIKAIVTFEAVGYKLLPGFDVGRLSRRHVHSVLLKRFGPLRLAQESLTALPELADALAKAPRLLTEALELIEQTSKRPSENPFAGLRGTLFGGFCLVAGAVLAGFGGPWPLWVALLVTGILLPLRRGR